MAARGFGVRKLGEPAKVDGQTLFEIASNSKAFTAAALAMLVDAAPEFVLLGTGTTLERPAPALARALEAAGIGLEPMDSRAAARAWGVLRGEGRRIAAALYPID